MVSSGVPSLDKLLGDGYPDKSAILVVGPPGIGKQALCYWFTHSGSVQGDASLYITRLTVHEVLQDIRGFGIDIAQVTPVWLASDTGDSMYDATDLASLSAKVSDFLEKNRSHRIRIVTDVLSSLLVLNSPEVVYRFLSKLFSDVKGYNAVLLASLEDGMHRPEILATMQQLFDGVVELRMYEDRLRLLPLLRIAKMRGMPPLHDYFRMSFSKTGLEVSAYVKELGVRGWLRGPG